MISVITPCYNDGATLEGHIKSFLDQDYENKELVLIDDGSKDNTKKILKKYEKNKDIKVIYFKGNRGACVARNEGAKVATGDVYSFLPADSFIFPGVLTIWMEQLRDNPDCAFIYGGYYFVDNEINLPSWEGGRVVMPYHSQEFDIRDLKTSNYIDGSFPIQKEAYWGAAKKVGLKDGLWNPSVKSLQDWDFWLSVVLDYGAKGKFMPLAQCKNFETTMPHKDGLSDDSSRNWLARVKQIQSLHKIPYPKLCVAAPFASFHGQSVAKVLDADYKDFPPFKPHDYKAVYVIGFFIYNFEDIKSLFSSHQYWVNSEIAKAKGQWNGSYPLSPVKKLVHFIGSDILTLQKLTIEQIGIVKDFLNNKCDGVFAEFEATQKELAAFGIKADVVPFPPRKWYDIVPLPKKKAVAVYLPKGNELFYFHDFFVGSETAKGLVQMMPDVDFHFFGNWFQAKPPKAKNYKIWGVTNGVGDIIKETNAIVRITKHDGLPISVAEWIGAGRNALTSVEMPHADHFDLIDFMRRNPNISIKELLKELKEAIYKTLKKPLNEEGAEYYRKWLDTEKYRKTINQYINYDEKRYWERRSDSWDVQAGVDKVKEGKLKEILAGTKFNSVIDVGCGNGRFVPYFEGKEYIGFDISKRLVEICKKKFQDKQFFVSSVEEVSVPRKYDLAFSYTCLEHVPPENIHKAVDALKGVAKQILLIEPKKFVPSGDYCFSHDYKELFKVKKQWSMGDKVAYLI